MLTINASYVRIAPNGDKSMVAIDTQNAKEYHESLQKEGFIYREQNFDRLDECLSCQA